jgi:AcrR family transcriptional regulator
MSTLSKSDPARLLDAAAAIFARYGFRRATMTDIAREAGLSRPALYLAFANKAAVLRALAAHIRERAAAAARAGWADDLPLAEALAACILARDLPLYRLLHASPHGAELMGADADLTAETARAMEEDFAAFLGQRAAALARRGEADWAAFGGARGFGAAMAELAAGIKSEARDEAGYVDSIRRLARIVAAASRKA